MEGCTVSALAQQIDLPINYEKSHFSVRKLAREEYVKRQSGLCWYCEAPLSGDPIDKVKDYPIIAALFPKNMFDWPVHLHHDRSSGMTIGAVHCRCNAVLWQEHHE